MAVFSGLQIYDINFAKERVVYEIGMQETLNYYTGNTPFDKNKIIIDGIYMHGGFVFELLKGKFLGTIALILLSM